MYQLKKKSYSQQTNLEFRCPVTFFYILFEKKYEKYEKYEKLYVIANFRFFNDSLDKDMKINNYMVIVKTTSI